MNTKYVSHFVAWCVLLALALPASAAGPLTGEQAIQHLKDTGQYESLAAAMTGARYGIQPVHSLEGLTTKNAKNAEKGETLTSSTPHSAFRTPDSFFAPNPAHGLRSTFTREGVRLEVRSGEATHQVAWRLDSLGYGAAQIAVPPGELKVSGQRVEISRGDLLPIANRKSRIVNPQLVEWFNNTPGGLEHGFTLAERPVTNPRGEALRLVLAVTGDLAPQADAAGQNLWLRDAAGQTVLTYEKLKVWDATGAELPATMRVADGKVTLTVEEANAHYPLTIDPTFAQQAYVKASNTGAGDEFGISVAVWGDTVVIGADAESSNATGINGNESDNSVRGAGAVYVFVRSGTTWTQQAYLKASNTGGVGDVFGWSVAVSSDTVVVGARNQSGTGAAYVFVRSGTNWSQQAYLKASNAGAGDLFGSSVAVSGDTVLVGAWGEDSNAIGVNPGPAAEANNSANASGAAYVFVRNGATWSQQAYLKASNVGAVDNFGWSVSVSGDTVVVGAVNEASNATGINPGSAAEANNSAGSSGAAYVFTRSGTTWSQQAYLKASNAGERDIFGWSVSVSGDTVVVGAYQESSNATGVNPGSAAEANNSATASGAAYVFTRSGTTWSQQAYLKASNTEAFDHFGYSVAVAGDAVVVGARFEDSSAIGVNGDESNNSAEFAGAAYVFVRSGTTWTQRAYLKASNPGADDRFGSSVAVSGDTVVVGASTEDSNATGVNPGPVAEANNNALISGAAYIFAVSAPCPVVADPAGPFTDTIGPIKPFVVLRENEALAGGQMIGAPSVVGFNDAGQLALRAVQVCTQAEAPGNNYLLRLTVPGSGPVKELSSFVPSLARTNIGLRLRDDGGIISFDSFDSPSNEDPPIVNGRIWQGGSFALLPAALREVGDAIAFGGEVKARAVSANGNFYLVAISRIGGRETILLNGQGTALQTFPDVVPFEPIQISDDGQFLGAPSSNPDNIHVYQPNGQAIQIGNPVPHIRLSRDGTALARLDNLASPTLSFVLRVVNPGGAIADTVINPSASDTFVDPFETWRGTGGSVIQANQIIGGVRKFLDVLAVQRLNRPLGDQIMTVIEAEDTAGVAGLYYIRSSAGSGKVFASGKIPRIAGLAYPDTAGHSAGSDAFLNRRGEILVQDRTPVFDEAGGVTGMTIAFSILHANTLTKFKQGNDGTALLTGLAANPETRWFNQPVNPNTTKLQNFDAVGCTLTSMATIASFYGRETTPLGMRDIMLSLGAINAGNATTVSKCKVVVGNKTLVRVAGGGAFADLVAELRGGNAVLLKVPFKGSSGVAKNVAKEELPPMADGAYQFNGSGHFIAAYGLNPALGPASIVTAADILISDPAYTAPYSGKYGTAYTAGEELVHVTLADYFNRVLGSDPNYVFDVLEWFDHNRFHRSTGELVKAAELSQIQRWRVVEGPLPPEPTIDVFSPVELAITANGKRYVSAPALASAGDILLERIGPDNIGAFDEENQTGTGADDPFDEFPPYTLLLPPELAGLSLDFEILGIGAGSYKVVLNPAKPGFEAASFLAGNTTLGQTNLGHIEVVVATNTFAGWAVGFPALGNQNGFSDDPDGDGVGNGFERFLGTHPLEASAGLTLTAGSTIAGFQHTRSKFPGTDAVAAYEWSTNLTTWHPSGETVAGISVTLTAVVIATTATTETVAITPISTGAPSVLFYRLRLQRLE